MGRRNVKFSLYCDDANNNQKKLFETALRAAQKGKVLYILQEQLTQLPELSQELGSLNAHYMKMISFLYSNNMESLLDNVSTLPDWQNVPSTIILEDLGGYCGKNMQNACGVVAMLIDAAHSCSMSLKMPTDLYVSVTRGTVGDEFSSTLNELFSID